MGGIGCRLLFTLIIYCILLHVIRSLCRLVAAASARPCVSTLFYSITVFVPWWMVAARRVERTDSIILQSSLPGTTATAGRVSRARELSKQHDSNRHPVLLPAPTQ